MPTADPMMVYAQSPASPFGDFQPRRDTMPAPRAKRLFMRKLADDPLARLVSNALRQEQWELIGRAVREQEKRRLGGWAPYRLLRTLAAWIA
jgi:hypothetical protein